MQELRVKSQSAVFVLADSCRKKNLIWHLREMSKSFWSQKRQFISKSLSTKRELTGNSSAQVTDTHLERVKLTLDCELKLAFSIWKYMGAPEVILCGNSSHSWNMAPRSANTRTCHLVFAAEGPDVFHYRWAKIEHSWSCDVFCWNMVLWSKHSSWSFGKAHRERRQDIWEKVQLLKCSNCCAQSRSSGPWNWNLGMGQLQRNFATKSKVTQGRGHVRLFNWAKQREPVPTFCLEEKAFEPFCSNIQWSFKTKS